MGKILQVEISDTLYSRFYKAVTNKKGKWRGSEQSAGKAFQTAIEAALQEFLNSLENRGNGSSSKNSNIK